MLIFSNVYHPSSAPWEAGPPDLPQKEKKKKTVFIFVLAHFLEAEDYNKLKHEWEKNNIQDLNTSVCSI